MKRLIVASITLLTLSCSNGKVVSDNTEPGMDQTVNFINGRFDAWVGALGKTKGTNYHVVFLQKKLRNPIFDSLWISGTRLVVADLTQLPQDTLKFNAFGPVIEVNPEPIRGQAPTDSKPEKIIPPVVLGENEGVFRYWEEKKAHYVNVSFSPAP